MSALPASSLLREPAPPFNLPLVFGAKGGPASVFVDAARTESWSATLSAEASPWLKIRTGASGTGPGLVTLAAQENTGGAHTATLTVTYAGGRRAPLAWSAAQTSAVPLATLNASVLHVPWPDVPVVMELAIAGKFIGQEIAKIPEPFTLLALVLVELLVLALGLLLVALRAALAPLVPEPETWFGVPPDFALLFEPLTEVQPATAVFLIEETALLAIQIAEEALGGGE